MTDPNQLLENFKKKVPQHHARLWDVTLGQVNEYIGELLAAQEAKTREEERLRAVNIIKKNSPDEEDMRDAALSDIEGFLELTQHWKKYSEEAQQQILDLNEKKDV